MKKLLLFVTALLGGVISSSATTTEITDRFRNDGYTWDENESKTVNGDGSITYEALQYKGLAIWYGGVDLSEYNQLVMEFKVAPTVQVQMKIDDYLFPGAIGSKFLICDLESGDFTNVQQMALQCTTAGGGTIEISKVYYRSNTYSATGTVIPFDEYGCVLSSNLNGFNDYDKVEFAYDVTGSSGYVGWGCGSLNSRKGNVKITTFSIKGDGTSSYVCTIGDLRAALEDGPDEYNIQGLAFNVYGHGDGACKVTRKSVTVYPAIAPVTINEYNWATFVSSEALDFTGSDVKAYIVLGRQGTALTKNQITGTVPANTPLLLNAAEGNYNIPVVASSTTDVSANLLKAGTGAAISAESGKTKYVLGVTAGKAEFQKINATAATVPTGKAYLEFNEVIEARSLDFDDEGTTAIKNMKVGENDNIYYDLQGRRVLYPKNGLYIVNGKKVIVK